MLGFFGKSFSELVFGAGLCIYVYGAMWPSGDGLPGFFGGPELPIALDLRAGSQVAGRWRVRPSNAIGGSVSLVCGGREKVKLQCYWGFWVVGRGVGSSSIGASGRCIRLLGPVVLEFRGGVVVMWVQ